MTKTLRRAGLALLASLGAGFSGVFALAQSVAIMDGTVHIGNGTVIEAGDIIVRNGRIAEIGADLSAPDGMETVEANGRNVTPGFIAPYSALGLTEIPAVDDANDATPDRDFGTGGASLDAADAFNPDTTLIPINRAGGITRAVSMPAPGGDLFGGRGILVDLSGKTVSISKRDVAMSVLLGDNGSGRAGGTRLGVWAKAREILDEANRYASDPLAYRRLPSDGRIKLADLAALEPVIDGEMPLYVFAHRAADIRRIIDLQDEYGLNVVLVGGDEAWREAEALANADIPVIIDALSNLPADFDRLGATLNNAARLHEAGIELGFYNPPGFGTHNLRLLTQLAGNAVAEGLPFQAGLTALTLGPARMIGVDKTLGSLETGKLADIVVWDGDPLEVTSAPVMVFINGERQDLDSRSKMLRDRYRDLSRGDLPRAYEGER